MKLATLRLGGSTVAARIEDDKAVFIREIADVGELLLSKDWRSVALSASSDEVKLSSLDRSQWAPVIPRPSKIICVGLNYQNHILEMGRQLPEHPTLFAKFAEALVGPYDPIVVPKFAASSIDWEAELAVVIGTTARHVDETDALSHIAGYSALNDVTIRNFQYRTTQWMQGKTFESTCPLGPVLVTSDEFSLRSKITTEIDGELVQQANTDDLVFSPAHLISYISNILTLNPGDIIATGTPGGVGHAQSPQRYLQQGNRLETSISGIGSMNNVIMVETPL